MVSEKSDDLLVRKLRAEVARGKLRESELVAEREHSELQRKLAEKKLRETAQWMEAVISSLDETVFVVTPDLVIMSLNEAGERMFGYSKEELANLAPEEVHVDQEHFVEFQNRVKEAFDRGESAHFEFELRRRNGEVFPTSHSVSLLKNEAGESLGRVSIVRDLSEPRRAEEKRLQRIVTERTNELNAANKLLEQLSHTDGLTGVGNRRYMDNFLGKEWSRAIRSSSPLSFVLIDIDYFKLYNDNYGHLEGDECLKRVAAKLESLIQRPSDMIARFGGEEFALVLPDTEEAEYVASRCLASIEDMRIPHRFSRTADVVTISAGFCTALPKVGTDPGLVIDSADRALYRAKEGGRNRAENGETHL